MVGLLSLGSRHPARGVLYRLEDDPLNYLAFLRAHARFLIFGFALAFFSSFGQTYFIGLFGEEIRGAFDLSEGRYGTLYSIATLSSGFCVIWLGRQLDRVDLRLYSTLVCVGLVGACFAMGLVCTAVGLMLALFALRLFGQGLASHTAMTSMARYFDEHRGKAMSIAVLGFAAGEAALPRTAVSIMESVGWRRTWMAVGVAAAVVMVPLVLVLLRGHGDRHRALVAGVDEADDHMPAAPPFDTSLPRQWTRLDVLRDPRFCFVLPTILAPAFIVTGLFFHQATLIAEKGWSREWFAAGFIAFAAAQVPSSLLAGPLVDRVGAARLLPIVLVPLAVALLVLTLGTHPLVALVFMVMAGLTSGIFGPIIGALWAELYGVLHLGAIRAMASAIMVFSTALSPVAMGLLIDRQVTMATISGLCLAFVVAASALVLIAGLHRRETRKSDRDR